jgi:hypothetical protein
MAFAGKIISCVVLGLTGLLGGGTLFAFMLFLYIGPFGLMSRGPVAECLSLSGVLSSAQPDDPEIVP